MKNFYFGILFLILSMPVFSQTVFKSLQIDTAGQLNILLTANEKASITKLKLIGKINAADFKIMRASMPKLDSIDLANTKILAYSGTQGTNSQVTSYPANTIPDQAFIQDTTIRNIVLPDSTTDIASAAFYMTFGIQKIEISSLIKSVGAYAFYGCGAVINVDIANTLLSSENGVLFNKNKTQIISFPYSKLGSYTIPNTVTTIKLGAFAYCVQLTEIIIPSSVKIIEDYAFDVCYGLQTLIIPASVTNIGKYSFGHCDNVKTVYCAKTLPPTINSLAFYGMKANGVKLFVPFNSINAYKASANWNNSFILIDGYWAAGIEEAEFAEVKFFPNPVIDHFNLTGINSKTLVKIFDIKGVEVFSKSIESNEQIDVQNFPIGKYFLKLQSKSGNQTSRIFVKM